VGKMGLDFGLDQGAFCKRNFRWLFYIPQVCGDESPGAHSLPPQKSARPSLSFKEMEVKHLNEDVYYPAKPDWKPITITMYDLALQPYAQDPHPVFNWVKTLYDPERGKFLKPLQDRFITEAYLKMHNGCGDLVEMWVYEDAWAQSVNFQNLDMADSNVTVCDLTLRYARAYVISLAPSSPSDSPKASYSLS
jgi:hypothetical protein